MPITILKQAVLAVVLAGTLGPATGGPSVGQARAGAQAGNVVAQFCLPPPADGSDAHRFYCRWPG